MPSVLVPGVSGADVLVDYDQPTYAALARGFVGPTSLVYDTFTGPVGGTETLGSSIDVQAYAVGATTDGGIGGSLYLIDPNVTLDQNILSGYGSNVVLYAPSGGGNIIGGGTDTVVIGGEPGQDSGPWTIDDDLFAGSGASTLSGGGGSNAFGFGIGPGGEVTVTDFNAADVVELLNGVTITGEDLQTDPGNLLVTLSDNTKVTFTGLTSDLANSQVFHF